MKKLIPTIPLLFISACVAPSIDPNLPPFTTLTTPDQSNGYQYIKSFEFSQPSSANAKQNATYCITKHVSYQQITQGQSAASMWNGLATSNHKNHSLDGGTVIKYDDGNGNLLAQGRERTQFNSGMVTIPINIEFQLEVKITDTTTLIFDKPTSTLGSDLTLKPIGSWPGAQGITISRQIESLADKIYDCLQQ
ncbi:hypothetical protein AB4876_09345 [Zhongshania guokunii]|uniref:Uncharacterized protein n=1 Tax=Zhongshania guokunii TaxID=641783 RepID=A0ABV3U6N4_9GAMM